MNETNVNEPYDRALERAESAAVASLCTTLSDAQSRTRKLRNSAPPGTLPDANWVAEVLEELDAARKALCLAEEELQTHADRLCRLQGALGIERRRYREMFDDAPEPYLTTDANGVILETNPRASQLFGVSCFLLSGKPLAQFVAPADRTSFRDALGQLACGGSLSRLTLRIWPLAASEPLVVTLSVSGGGRSEQVGLELRWIIHEHEPRSSQRAPAGLHQPSASEAGAPRRAPLGRPTIDRRAGDMTRPRKTENGPVDLLDVISDVLESCQPAAGRADVQLVAKFDCGLCSVPADPIHLEHILRAILANALAFTPRRGALEVSACTEKAFIDIFVREGAGRGPTVHIRTPLATPAPTH